MWWWLVMAVAGGAEEYSATIAEIDAPTAQAMRGVSLPEGCPTALEDLVVLKVAHHDFEGGRQMGTLIVARSEAEGLREVFRQLYEAGYPIERMRPAHTYDGSDAAMMADNNTSAFNCRKTTSGSRWSEHSYGTALDLNPAYNPYVRGETVLPARARPWADRTAEHPALIHAGDPVVTAFAGVGWRWGGLWRSIKDFQHFSRSGR